MAKLAPNSIDFPDFDASGGWQKAFEKQDAAYEELAKVSAAIDFANPSASLKGALLKFPRGDGYALYVVTADRPLTVAHVPYGDAWQVEGALIRGLTRADVVEQLYMSRGERELFDKKH